MSKMKFIVALAFIGIFASNVYAQSIPEVVRNFGKGTIVSFDANSQSFVELASLKNIQSLSGVSKMERTRNSSDVDTFDIARSGTYEVLVSDINGAIKKGDEVSVSSIPGVGARFTDQARALGEAQTNFDVDSSEDITSFVDSLGIPVQGVVRAGLIEVNIAITPFEGDGNIANNIVDSFTDELARRGVGLLQFLIASFVLLTSIVLASRMARKASKESIQAIGRNPLSKEAINSSLRKTYLFAAGLIVAGLILSLVVVFI